MHRLSWIHFLYSKEVAYYLKDFIRKNDAIFVISSALIDGTIQSNGGHFFGKKGMRSLVLLTQSDGRHVIEEMVRKGLTDYFHTMLLDDFNLEELEGGGYVPRIKNAIYITEDEYIQEVEDLPEYSRDDIGLSVEGLKSILADYDDSSMVQVWREIYDSDYYKKLMGDRTEKFDTCYDINGDLTFKISTSVDDLESIFKSVKIDDIFRKAKGSSKLYETSIVNVYGEANYYKNEYKNIKKALTNLFYLTRPNEPAFGLLHSDEIDVLSWKIRRLLNCGKNDQIHNLLEKASSIISKAYEQNPDIKNSNYYLKIKTRKDAMNSHTPFFITFDDKYIVFGTRGNLIKFLELKTGEITKKFESHEKGHKIEVLKLSPDGKYFAGCSSKYDEDYYSVKDVILIRNIDTGELITKINEHILHSTDYKNCITIPKGNKYIISGLNSIKIWNFKNGDLIHQIEEPHDDKIYSLQSSPDGKYIISTSIDSTIKTWDIETYELVHVFNEHKRAVTDASFSPDGKYIISNSWDKTIKVWEFLTGDVLKTINVGFFESSPYKSMISPNGSQILANVSFGDINKPSMVKVWDFNTSKLLQTLFWKNGEGWGYITDAKFSPKGNYLVSTSYDYHTKIGMINICVTLNQYYNYLV